MALLGLVILGAKAKAPLALPPPGLIVPPHVGCRAVSEAGPRRISAEARDKGDEVP